MTELADVLAKYEHDRAFCGRMTKAGIPCQRQKAILIGDCPRHNPLNEVARALPKMFEALGDAISRAVEAVDPYKEQIRRVEERRRIRTWYVEFDPAEQPPALKSP